MKSKSLERSKRQSARKHGFSLIEMLMGMFIMSFVAAAIAEIATVQNVIYFKTYGKLDNIIAARRAANDIEQAVHMARFIGDQYGQWPPPSLGSGPNYFPGGDPSLTLDPYRISGLNDSLITGFAGFPGTTSNSVWPGPPYFLSQQTLILQVPVFSVSPPDACPTMMQYAPTPLTGNRYWNVDTYVYQVLADSTKPGMGQFILQKSIFPGEHNPNTQPMPPITSNAPMTLMTGIIGPVNPNGTNDPVAGTPLPLVFSFIQKSTMSTTTPATITTVSGSDAPNLIGVSLNFELSNASSTIRADYVPSPIAYHSEFYVRSNANSVF